MKTRLLVVVAAIFAAACQQMPTASVDTSADGLPESRRTAADDSTAVNGTGFFGSGYLVDPCPTPEGNSGAQPQEGTTCPK